MQDLPYLVLRLLLIFKYGVLSYTNMFFTCKNTLVITLLLYRLVVVQMERKKATSSSKSVFGSSNYIPMTGSMYGSNSALQKNLINWYDYDEMDNYQGYGRDLRRKSFGRPLGKGNVKTVETKEDIEPVVSYVIKPHHSTPCNTPGSASPVSISTKKLNSEELNSGPRPSDKETQLNNGNSPTTLNQNILKGVML